MLVLLFSEDTVCPGRPSIVLSDLSMSRFRLLQNKPRIEFKSLEFGHGCSTDLIFHLPCFIDRDY